MTSMQYTIRSIPSNLDRALRRKATASGKSLNEVVIEALSRGAGVDSKAKFDDLDWFVGKKTLGSSFDEAERWLETAPKEIDG